jgi:interleukin-1 receptor-associated kinase 1
MMIKLVTPSGVSIGVVMLALGASSTYAIQEKRRLAVIKSRHFRQHGGQLLFEEMKKSISKQGISFTLFTRQELQEATGDFDERHVLGKGGNGTVYRGTLRDGTAVAIKRCRVAGEDERQQREFGRETLILSQINHKNIVKLYGCCLEVEVPMLVYQFIPNGTLYQLIHGGSGAVVPFAARMRIAHETAEALAYLHSMASPPIIHGDVKSPNILLDECYGAKVSDFGASSLAPAPADEAHLVTFVQGTCGYLDPEYMQTCRLTEKSDVYSFGVVLLELLTSRKALNLAAPDDEKSLAASFLSAARESRLDGLLDERIKSEVGAEALVRVAKLAKMCLEMSGERRPSMREVAEELGRIRKMSASSSQINPGQLLLDEGEGPSIVDVSER